MRINRVSVFVACIAGGLVISACGGGGGPSKEAQRVTTTTAAPSRYSTLESLVAHLSETESICLDPFYAPGSGPGVLGSPGGTTDGRATCTEGGIFFVDIFADAGSEPFDAAGECRISPDLAWVAGDDWAIWSDSNTADGSPRAQSILERVAQDEGLRRRTCADL